MTVDDATHIQVLERLQRLEDRLEIAERTAQYGQAADSGAGATASALWTEDGIYDAGIMSMRGSAAVEEMLAGDVHQGFLAQGVGHISTTPVISLDGDRAVSTCYSLVFRRDEATDAFRLWRMSANRWEWIRTPEGWRVTSRVNRPLDGTADARELFRASFDAR
ncbi:nuclear transport factor 2 family protein [Herbiconiux ginsengi]|uniref:SnoaL-like domain-containing protein n=1 Tax=Herbiconiux ginsengi TaxID=381665 RepID=A0A1H3TGY7_9MICO|nr:nuclear transport factor 2 family protein [Herbiconiux ginsengi]SDZ49091.1 SnoaL-like domain-containing protein [Herbiconiux ginsengi]